MGVALLFALTTANAQTGSVSINTDGSTADLSAMLEVKSTTQGVLIPRMTTQQRNLIGSPNPAVPPACWCTRPMAPPGFTSTMAPPGPR